MEGFFGSDFSSVRVHEGSEARSMGADAFTMGDDVHFAPGKYDPSSTAGRELLGHELAHVVQQREGRVEATRQAHGLDLNDDDGLEHEADVLGARAARYDGPVGAPAAAETRATSTAQRKVAQRRVGFEFDVETGWSIKGRRPNEEGDPTPITDTKKYVLMGENNAGLTSDNGRAEFRTEPLSTLGEVDAAITDLVALAARFRDDTSVLDGEEAQYALDETGRDHVVIEGTGDPHAKPQATFGVRLDALERFHTRLAEFNTNRRNADFVRQRFFAGDEQQPSNQEAKKRAKRMLGGGVANNAALIATQAGQLYTAATTALLQAQQQDEQAFTDQDVAAHRDEIVGLIIAMLRMLYDAFFAAENEALRRDIKDKTPLMARTDYRSMFRSMHLGARALMTSLWGQGQGPFATAFNQLFVNHDLGERMFPHGYKSPDDQGPVAQRPTYPGPRKREWIDSVVRGGPAHGKDLMAQPQGYNRIEGLGAMGADPQDGKLMIFEHRGAAEQSLGNLGTGDWKQFARSMFRMVEWSTQAQAQQQQAQPAQQAVQDGGEQHGQDGQQQQAQHQGEEQQAAAMEVQAQEPQAEQPQGEEQAHAEMQVPQVPQEQDAPPQEQGAPAQQQDAPAMNLQIGAHLVHEFVQQIALDIQAAQAAQPPPPKRQRTRGPNDQDD